MSYEAPLAAMVAAARSQIGYVEQPVNRTKFGIWFGWNGVAWCAIFVSWAFAEVGAAMPPLSNKKGAAYCPTIKDHAVASGQWRPIGSGYRPKLGDLILYKFTNRIDHIGIIIGILPDGRYWTVEGNTNAVGSRTGGMVANLYRRSKIAGFIDVRDTTRTPPVVVPPTPAPTPPPHAYEDEDDVAIYLRDPKTQTIFCFGANTFQRFTWDQWQRRIKEGIPNVADDWMGGAIIMVMASTRDEVTDRVQP